MDNTSKKLNESVLYVEVDNPRNPPIIKSKMNRQAAVKYILIILVFLVLSKFNPLVFQC